MMRLRRLPVPTRMIFEANSTPMVCEERWRHSFLVKRWRRQDLGWGVSGGWSEVVRRWETGDGEEVKREGLGEGEGGDGA